MPQYVTWVTPKIDGAVPTMDEAIELAKLRLVANKNECVYILQIIKKVQPKIAVDVTDIR